MPGKHHGGCSGTGHQSPEDNPIEPTFDPLALSSDEDWLESYRDEVVVCDLADGYMIFGTLCDIGPEHLAFINCDLHDLREANSTKDVYAIESRDIGVRKNRDRCTVPRRQLLAISRLNEVSQ